jgi:hypothetical protein
MILPLGEGPEAWSDNLNFKIVDWPTSGTFPGTTLPFFANYIKDAEGLITLILQPCARLA